MESRNLDHKLKLLDSQNFSNREWVFQQAEEFLKLYRILEKIESRRAPALRTAGAPG